MRPRVSVVVPLHGDQAYADRARAAFAQLELSDGDELIVADNNADPDAAASAARDRDGRQLSGASVVVLRPQRRGRGGDGGVAPVRRRRLRAG